MGPIDVYQLSPYQSVIIRPRQEHIHTSWQDKDFRYEGVVKNVRYHYKNRSMKALGKDRSMYIGFLDTTAYHNLLLKGSLIICNVHDTPLNCFIVNIVKDASNQILFLEVAIYDDEDVIRPFPITYKITVNSIDSMLITYEEYQFQII
jgi:hypothetical protein